MMKTSEVLKRAKAKIEQGWCQRYPAVSKESHHVPAESKDAVKWCALGAIDAVSFTFRQHDRARRYLDRVTEDGAIFVFNDRPGTTQQDVIAKFDQAIKLAEEAGD